MEVKNLEKKENNTVEFQVESDAAEFEKAVNEAYLKNRGSIYIAGFRKGKAPRKIIEGMYGAEVFYQDALDSLAPSAFELGVEKEALRIVGAPSIVDVNVTEEKTALFTFAVTLYPEVTLGQYKGVEVEKEDASVTDEEVRAEIENARKRNARMVSIDDRAAQMGDTVNIDFDGFLEGERFDGGKAEGYSLELGSGSFVPGFEEQVVGMSIGEEKDIDVTFPENYAEGLAGKAVVFKIKLNEVTVRELPELDDEFAKDVSEFDTLDEYTADIRKHMEEKKAEAVKAAVRSEALRIAGENMTVEIPEAMVMEKVEEMLRNYAANFGLTDRSVSFEQLCQMMGINEEVLNSSIRPSAEAQVRNDLLIEAVVAAEAIEASEDEVAAYLQKVAEGVGASVDEVKAYFGDEFIAAEAKKEKAAELIVDNAVIVEAKAE